MDTKQQLVNALAGLGSTITEAMDVIEGFVPCGHPALTVSNALVALDADDDAALAQQLETVEGFIDHVSENRGVAAYHGIEVELGSQSRSARSNPRGRRPYADCRRQEHPGQRVGLPKPGSTKRFRRKGCRKARRSSRHQGRAFVNIRRGPLGASSSKRPANSSRQPIAAPPRSAKARIGIIWCGVFAARSACSSSLRSLVTK